MATKSTGKSIPEREQEIRTAEQNLAAVEAQQAAEIARLEDLANRLVGKVQALRATANRPEMAGSGDPQVVALAQRLDAVVVPRGSFDEPREQALAARLEALNMRGRAAEKLRQAIRAQVEELTKLDKALSEQDRQLQDHQVRLDLERARQDEARQEQARQEQARQEQARRAAEEQARQAAARTEPEMPVPQVEAPAAPKAAAAAPPPQAPAKLLAERQSRVRMQASVDLESESNFFQGFSTNLSEGGLFVATVTMLPRGTQVDLHFTLPGGRKIDAKGVVRWTREVNDRTPDIFPGVGVQFVDLSPEATAAIKSFVSEREPLFFAD